MRSARTVQISVMGSVRFVKTDATDSVKFTQIRVMNSVFIRGEGRAKSQEETGETKSTSRRNRFLALTAIESDDDEEINAIETVQEIVDITVDSGAAKSV